MHSGSCIHSAIDYLFCSLDIITDIGRNDSKPKKTIVHMPSQPTGRTLKSTNCNINNDKFKKKNK